MTVALPPALTAAFDRELLITPQPRLAVVLPMKVIPVTSSSSSEMRQYSPI